MAEIDTASVSFIHRLHAKSVLLIRVCARDKRDVLRAAQTLYNRSGRLALVGSHIGGS
jgi:hypothetical protein